MPFDVILADKNSQYRVLYWSSQEKKFCLGKDCPNVTKGEHENFGTYLTEYVKTGAFPRSKTKYRKLKDNGNVHEIKPSDQLRLLGGFRGSNFIIVLCIRKKGDTPLRSIDTTKKRLKQSSQEKLP